MRRTNKSSLRSTVRSVPFAVAAALVVSGCNGATLARVGEYQRAHSDARLASLAQRSAESEAPPTQLTRPDERDYVASAAYWGAQVQANPDDVEAALHFSRNLRMMGGASQAVTVMKGLVLRDPQNARVLAEYGKALTAADRPHDGIGFLTQAIQLSPNDWSLLSARGVAFDQAGDHTAARADYQQALAIDEDNPSVMTNLALSYVLSGQPSAAEPILRQVVARSDATAAMRQNLAMVLALQGRHGEATEMGKLDLPPDDAVSNARLFAQFDVAPSSANAANASPPSSGLPSAPQILPKKIEIAAVEDKPATSPKATPDPIAGDLMSTPIIANAPQSAPSATQSPRNMAPIADDNLSQKSQILPSKPKITRKPAQPSATQTAATKPVTPPPTARAISSNGETLITTINGIPVIGDAKPVKGKPSASIGGGLRGGAL